MGRDSIHLKDSRLIKQSDLEGPLNLGIGPNACPADLEGFVD